MLNPSRSILMIVDVQGKLAQLMYEKEMLFAGLEKIIRGIRVLEIPVLWLEQNPKGLGPTIPEISALLEDLEPISKMSFSCCRNESFTKSLQAMDRSQVLITGIETHICIYQTTMDLLSSGYEVEVVTDAVSSRTPENKSVALERMRDAGAALTTAEMALFELLGVAQGPKFKKILDIVK